MTLPSGQFEPYPAARDRHQQQFDRTYLTGLLARHNGNAVAAAIEAGVHKSYLYRLKNKVGL